MNDPTCTYTVDIEVDEAYVAEVETGDIDSVIQATLRHAKVPAASLTVAITGDETVRSLNNEYRGVDAPTDVLSFASQGQDATENDAGFVLPAELAGEMAAYLGDIVIAFPYAAQQAGRFGNSVAAELRLLAVHGTLHLLGYDHDTPQSEAAMWAAQDAILAAFGDHSLTHRSYDA